MKKLNRLIFPPRDRGDHNRVDFWRERVLHYMLLTALVLGLVALLPSVWLSLREGLFALAIFDLLAYAYVVVIFIWRGLGYRIRAILFAAIGYFIGIFVTLKLGPAGAGLYWIFVAPPMASLLLGLPSGVLGIGLNALILVWLGYLITFQPQSFPQLAGFSLSTWIVNGLNYLTANALVTLPLGALLDGMRLSFEREAQTNIAYSFAQQESKQRDVSLGESEERFSKFFHLNPVGMVLARLQDGRIIDVNQAWGDVYGYSKEAVRGRTMEELGVVTPEVRQSIRQELKNKGSLRNFEVPAHTRDGTVRHVLISVENFPIGDDLFLLTTVFDITERKRAAEEIIIANKELLFQNEEKEKRAAELVIANKELLFQNEEKEKRAAELSTLVNHLAALHNIDLAITGSLDLQLVLNVVLEQATTQLRMDAASVLLLNSHSQTLTFGAGRGFRKRAIEQTRLKLGEGLAGEAAFERRLVRLGDSANGQGLTRSGLMESEGFVEYYAAPLVAKGKVSGVLEVFHRATFEADDEWRSFLGTLAGQAAIAVDSARLFEDLQSSNNDLVLSYDATIEGWSRALDLRDQETEGHTLRVAELAEQLAEAMGTSEAELIHIRRGALLHDIGKMGVPDGILLKPGKLTDEEWLIMRKHPQLAFDLLSPIKFLKPALDIPYCHHEKWDGTGYPRGLKGDLIPYAARIFAVVDVFDALTSDRPYRKAWAKEKAIAYIKKQSGRHFDPQIVEQFLKYMNQI